VAVYFRKNRLAFWRKIRGYTQAEVANYMGVSTATVYNWEMDFRDPTPEQAKALAVLLQVKPRELFPFSPL
jgi:transcriptional regulator with XRE-family HTH domain